MYSSANNEITKRKLAAYVSCQQLIGPLDVGGCELLRVCAFNLGCELVSGGLLTIRSDSTEALPEPIPVPDN